ncbi:ChaC-like protein [Pisolithus orientalis]|uniref:ChaC-like protein n=1 Tax=Pisolithus orientalis TaxID=936130 RepID=UPI00222523B6|nr:ChaC-like protein [Pisolithus orientalis]KAI5997781.1 ChaC-like protein [Pisolithus orientalis]
MSSKTPYVVFGYGSLIFKPPPYIISEVPGFLKGYVRRFAQKSHDHRGTPENPGRVVTLVHKEDWDHFSGSDAFPDEDVVWGNSANLDIEHALCCYTGIAYTVNPLYESEVRDYLDYREKDGYTLETLDVYTIEDGVEKVIVHNCYVGHPDNPSFVGSEPLEALADRIWRSVGPSGRNKDYLYQLADSVRKLAPASFDSHLFALEVRLASRSQLSAPLTTLNVG